MKANPSQTILLQNLLKFLRNIIGLDQRTHWVHTDEIQKPLVVTRPAQVPLVRLTLLQIHKILVSILAEGERSHAGIALGRVFPDDGLDLSVVLFFNNCGGNGNGTLLEVDCRPAQTQ